MKEQGRGIQWGVSVVVCSHNGADRLPGTLAHLASQRVTRDLLWEVIVIDNASTDDTAGVARRHWVHETSGSFRI
ncbi:glycosyltransferase, partial [Enterococcus casseliflavus]|uniref:glycosyltransferase n=1 Tax=Enterococcus casseliflavus TaxID=37734 RepID=UPI003D109169